MNLRAKEKITVNTINKLTVVTLIAIYILGKARADASEIEIVIEFFRNFFTTSRRTNAQKMQNDLFTISSSMLGTYLL